MKTLLYRKKQLGPIVGGITGFDCIINWLYFCWTCFLTIVWSLFLSIPFQELRSREEELTKAALQQKLQEEFLRRREQELAEREIDLLEREINIMILQQVISKPTPRKRKGKFKKSRLKLLKSGGKSISEPSGTAFFQNQ